MSDRILVKVSADRYCLRFRIIDPASKERRSFDLPRGCFRDLEDRDEIIARDGGSFAAVRRDAFAGVLSVRFTWLSSSGGGRVTGWEQAVTLPCETLCRFAAESGKEDGPSDWAALALPDHRGKQPRIRFVESGNLHAVLGNRTLRRKLIRFLRDNFKWSGAERICFYDDFEPHSFFFREFRGGKPGLCGGLILHGRENPEKAYYSIHT